MKEGDWIRYIHSYTGVEYKGYIDEIIGAKMYIQPMQPYNKNHIVVYLTERNYWPIDTELSKEMLSTMIDIALDTKDEEWFNELINMRSGK